MSKPIYTLLSAALAALVLAGCGKHEESAHEEGGEAAHHHEDEHHDEGEHQDAGEHHDVAEIDDKTAGELGIRSAKVGPGIVRDAHEVQGLLTPIEGKHARVRARYAGPVQAVRVGVGDVVKAGQTLATIESNVSLTAYAVTAPFAGTILDVAAVPGDLAGDQPLFELADLTSLWVDLHLFGGDAQHISAGMPVDVIRLSDGATDDDQARTNSSGHGHCQSKHRCTREDQQYRWSMAARCRGARTSDGAGAPGGARRAGHGVADL